MKMRRMIVFQPRRNRISLVALSAAAILLLLLFLAEAIVLAMLGGISGFLIGGGVAWLIGILVPALPTHTAWDFVLLAEISAALIGLIAGVLPARHAARLDPVAALREE